MTTSEFHAGVRCFERRLRMALKITKIKRVDVVAGDYVKAVLNKSKLEIQLMLHEEPTDVASVLIGRHLSAKELELYDRAVSRYGRMLPAVPADADASSIKNTIIAELAVLGYRSHFEGRGVMHFALVDPWPNDFSDLPRILTIAWTEGEAIESLVELDHIFSDLLQRLASKRPNWDILNRISHARERLAPYLCENSVLQ